MATSSNLALPAIASPPRGSIIVVEDNQSMSVEGCLVLEDAGWDICSAGDGEPFRALLACIASAVIFGRATFRRG